jgi:hypothetical protein
VTAGVGGCRTSSSSGTTIAGPCDGIATRGAGTSSPSSSSGGIIAILGYDSKTAGSTTRMCFALGTSSSSYIMCVTNWSGETGSLQRRRRRWLDSLDGAMAGVLDRCWWVVCGYE